jgi:hypothetical protein
VVATCALGSWRPQRAFRRFLKTIETEVSDSPDHASRVYSSPVKPMLGSQVPMAASAAGAGGPGIAFGDRGAVSRKRVFKQFAPIGRSVGSADALRPSQSAGVSGIVSAFGSSTGEVVLSETSAVETDGEADTPPFSRSGEGLCHVTSPQSSREVTVVCAAEACNLFGLYFTFFKQRSSGLRWTMTRRMTLDVGLPSNNEQLLRIRVIEVCIQVLHAHSGKTAVPHVAVNVHLTVNINGP